MRDFKKKRIKKDVMNRIKDMRYEPRQRRQLVDAIHGFLNYETDFILGQNFILMRSPKSNAKRFAKSKTSLERLFDEYHKWALIKFPQSTYISSIEGLKREIQELEFEFHNTATTKTIAFEYVDIMMYLMDSARRYGISRQDFFHYFREKLEINKNRTWAINGDSSYSHVKSNEPQINPNESTTGC